MVAWTKDSVLLELNALTDETEQLARSRRYSTEHTRWLARTLTFLEEIFGRQSRYYLTFASYQWAQPGSFIVGGPGDPEGSWDLQAAVERRHHKAYREQLQSAKGLLLAATDHLKRAESLAEVYNGKDTAPESSLILKIINLTERKLRKTMRELPTREKEIQDAFENLLIGSDLPYSREAVNIEYSSKTYIPDFVIDKIDLAVDLKLCAREGREKEIIAEINDDILAYRTKFSNLLFVVYDTGHIRDVERFAETFEKNENVVVRVVKH